MNVITMFTMNVMNVITIYLPHSSFQAICKKKEEAPINALNLEVYASKKWKTEKEMERCAAM